MAKHKSADPAAESASHISSGKQAVPDTPVPGYTVLARRYRPQTFADLVGQEPIAKALTNAIEANRVAHAYLFTGTRGVGKTSTARILAKALNCASFPKPTPTPCNTCETCLSITSGEDVDVLEIDGASNRGVDEARELRANVQYRPSRSRYKIYIIDEVHMLTREAFNALLKTLEEPPPHVKFFLATTDAQKVPITILSRCQRFDFAGIPLPRMIEHLRMVTANEGIQAEPSALELISRRSGGSMRDAESLLDQLLAFGGQRLSADQVHHLLGTAGDERILSLASAILAADGPKTLALVDEACLSGLQLGELVEQLIAYWRDLMILNCAGEKNAAEMRNLSLASHHHATLREHARTLSLDSILAGLDVLSAARGRMQRSNHARTLVEMALVRLTRLGDLTSLSQLAQWVGQVRLDPRAAATQPSPAAPSQVSRNSGAVSATELAEKKKPLTGPAESPESAGTVELTPENWPVLWREIRGIVGVMLASEVEKAGPPAISGPNSLVFRFDAPYNQAGEFVQQPERLARLEEAARRVTGKPLIIRIERAEAEAGEPSPVVATQPARPIRGTAREEAEKVPLVRRALELFGATVQRLEDGFGANMAPARQKDTEER